VLAAVIFGLSPYVAAHFPGHFELTAVWTLPAFAFFFRRACRGSLPAAAAAGLAAAATAYTSYYYFVYEAIFAAAYAVAWFELVTASAGRRRGDGTSLRAARSVLVG